ncbi:MAG: leucyl/phenylalanyl-tRNA--protein transferase [bacterium]
MVARLDKRLWFPDPHTAESGRHEGLLAIGGDLSVERLVLAYRSGIFPWTVRPITWWSPDPRAIFELDRFHVSRSLAKLIRQGRFKVTVDLAFSEVISGCASSPRDGHWISKEFIDAYTALHEVGYAHSVECWAADGSLAGGVYGVSVGGLFAGESMFHSVSNASKVALCHLIQRLAERGFDLFDIQMVTPITGQLGAVQVSRDEYLRRLRRAAGKSCSFG